MNYDIEQHAFWEQPPALHPAILHLNASPNLSNDQVMTINKMVEGASKLRSRIGKKYKKPNYEQN